MTDTHADSPAWFKRSLAVQPVDHTIEVQGTPIHYLQWGDDKAKAGLIFVHGNGAHAHWWSFIAPFFLDHYRAIAIDLAPGTVVIAKPTAQRVLPRRSWPWRRPLTLARIPLLSATVLVVISP
jgi:pimeloyl-ACP methyl ester carboxylesterase